MQVLACIIEWIILSYIAKKLKLIETFKYLVTPKYHLIMIQQYYHIEKD